MFNVIEKEMAWRKEQGMPEGFEALRAWKPVVAVGAREPLGGQTMMADYFRMYRYLMIHSCSPGLNIVIENVLMECRWH